jgi:hypothetical protein
MMPSANALDGLLSACVLYCAEHDLDQPPEDPGVKDVGLWVGKMVFHAETHPDNKGAKLVLAANQVAGQEYLDEEP